MRIYIKLAKRNMEREHNLEVCKKTGLLDQTEEAFTKVRDHLLRPVWPSSMFSCAVSLDRDRLDTDPIICNRLWISDGSDDELYDGTVICLEWEDRIFNGLGDFVGEIDTDIKEPWKNIHCGVSLALARFFDLEQPRGGVRLKSGSLAFHSEEALDRQIDDGFWEKICFTESGDSVMDAIFGSDPATMPIRLMVWMNDSDLESPYYYREECLKGHAVSYC